MYEGILRILMPSVLSERCFPPIHVTVVCPLSQPTDLFRNCESDVNKSVHYFDLWAKTDGMLLVYSLREHSVNIRERECNLKKKKKKHLNE